MGYIRFACGRGAGGQACLWHGRACGVPGAAGRRMWCGLASCAACRRFLERPVQQGFALGHSLRTGARACSLRASECTGIQEHSPEERPDGTAQPRTCSRYRPRSDIRLLSLSVSLYASHTSIYCQGCCCNSCNPHANLSTCLQRACACTHTRPTPKRICVALQHASGSPTPIACSLCRHQPVPGQVPNP